MNIAAGGLEGKRCIELGAGVGLVSLVAALRGGSVIATDRIDNMGLLEQNVSNNSFAGDVRTCAHAWGEDLVGSLMEPFDLVIAAEVIYDERLFPPLIASLVALIQRTTKCLIAYKERGPEERTFFQRLKETGLQVDVTPLLDDDEYRLVEIQHTAPVRQLQGFGISAQEVDAQPKQGVHGRRAEMHPADLAKLYYS